METNFSTRSTGFQWFFSFLAAFSAYRDTDERVVVLLDEPGTSLHGEAQGDFLRYVYGELGPKQQVLYTTHSQHMIDPTRYETMRAIHDQATREDPSLGVVITSVSLSADPKTILPVEAALGYSVSQHLFLGSGPLLAVEGSSDFIFLMRVSDYLISQGRTGLDPRLAIIPAGGIGNNAGLRRCHGTPTVRPRAHRRSRDHQGDRQGPQRCSGRQRRRHPHHRHRPTRRAPRDGRHRGPVLHQGLPLAPQQGYRGHHQRGRSDHHRPAPPDPQAHRDRPGEAAQAPGLRPRRARTPTHPRQGRLLRAGR
ncbi:hypothetical protein ACWD4J_42745 [Streptomyces sp. NPDC002577]